MNKVPAYVTPTEAAPQNGMAARSSHINTCDLNQTVLYASRKQRHLFMAGRCNDWTNILRGEFEVSPYTKYLRVWVYSTGDVATLQIDLNAKNSGGVSLDTSRLTLTGPGVVSTSAVYDTTLVAPANDLDISNTSDYADITLEVTLTNVVAGYITRIEVEELLYDLTLDL